MWCDAVKPRLEAIQTERSACRRGSSALIPSSESESQNEDEGKATLSTVSQALMCISYVVQPVTRERHDLLEQ